TAEKVREVEAYFAALRVQRERAEDRVGLARLTLVIQTLTGGPSASAPATAEAASTPVPQAAGTPARRPDRRLTVFSIGRAAQNTYAPSEPSPVSRVPGDLGAVVAITGGRSHALVLLPNGRVRGWGTWEGEDVTAPAEATDVVRLDSSDESALALRADGKVAVWGPGKAAQLWEPPPGKAPSDICAGTNSSGFVLCTDGTLHHTDGAPGKTAEATPPVTIGPVARLTYIAGSGFCAIQRDGTALFWGEPTPPVTPLPGDLRDLSFLSFSERYAVAMQRDGTLTGWGDLAPGQRFRIRRFTGSLGVPRDPTSRLIPIHRGDHAWELVPNPSTPDYLAEDRVSVIEGRLRGCFDALFTEYCVLGLRPQ
ncbi:MAG: hypothetical protein U0984_19435, partial [Prosthecobacter sp.]|nr:hypothetical protein [Prosthecobacter sp.]